MRSPEYLTEHIATMSAALSGVFRGTLCDVLLPNRSVVTFDAEQVIYEVGGDDRTLYFIRDGHVRVGTITEQGREIIYDIRKAGDVVGELAACDGPRPDRAVALDRVQASPVPYSEIIDVLQRTPDTLRELLAVFCKAIANAYDQIDMLQQDDVIHRLVVMLLGLAEKIGRPAGAAIEIPTYLTQREISTMISARRERVSTALNLLRRRGAVHYSRRGNLVLDVDALRRFRA